MAAATTLAIREQPLAGELAVRKALEVLPASATGIARMFHDHGITGFKGAGASCPLANWLRYRFPGTHFYVDGLGISFGETERTHTEAVEELPEAVACFVSNFDEGCYPTLVERLALPAPDGAS